MNWRIWSLTSEQAAGEYGPMVLNGAGPVVISEFLEKKRDTPFLYPRGPSGGNGATSALAAGRYLIEFGK